MSQITSNISDRIYIKSKNCLPKNFIEDGCKFSTNGNNTLTVNTGTLDIAGNYNEITAPVNIDLPPRSANLIVARNVDGTEFPMIDKISAKIPTDMIDNNTVGFWDFSTWDGSSIVPNFAVGKSAIAVTNNLTKSGTVNRVDGWAGYGAQGDGSSGYFTSANSTWFPIGASERQASLLLTVNELSTPLLHYGVIATNQDFYVYTNGTGVVAINTYGSDYVTNFTVELGKTYLLDIAVANGLLQVYVNGCLVYSGASTFATSASILSVGRSSTAYSKNTFHYVELRNKMRTPQQIAQIANKLLLPCSYISDLVADSSVRTLGTPIGNLTSAGGLNAAFDNNTSQLETTCAKGATVSGQGKIGKNWGSDKKVTGAIVYGSSDYGFDSTNSAGTITLTLQGSNDGNNWTDLGQTVLSDTPNAVAKIYTSNQSSFSQHQISITSSNSATYIHVSEVQFCTIDTEKTNDITEILPSDSISLGFARTNSFSITEYDDSSWKYGRKEGAYGGNRRVFLGWKYFNGATILTWINPFGTRKIKTYYTWSQDARGTNESDVTFYHYASGDYGLLLAHTDGNRIRVNTQSGHICYFNGSWQASGYIGCYAEVLE